MSRQFSIVVLCLWLFMSSDNAYVATRTIVATGNWSSTSTWSGETRPATSDAVVIASGHVVMLDVEIGAGQSVSPLASITLNAATATNGITISGTNRLNVTGAITFE
jgi:hypothetical protein